MLLLGIPKEKDIVFAWRRGIYSGDNHKASVILEAGKSFWDSGWVGEGHMGADNRR